MMQIEFSFTHPVFGAYHDTLNLADDHALTDAEIQAMKQQRFDNWVAYVEAAATAGPAIELPASEPEVDPAFAAPAIDLGVEEHPPQE